jgi:O-antigen/teichoic acid export membrane protein
MAYSLVANTVGQIAQPVLVETDRSEAFRKMLRFTCFISMPLMFGFALVGREFILITIKEEWLECVPLLQVLCISGAFMPIHTMYQNLAISHGRSDIYMWLNIGQILLQIAVVFACSDYGMFVMVSAYSAMMILWLLPWHLFTGRLIGYSWWDVFKDVAPFTLTAIVTMAITYYATRAITNIYFLLIVRCILATAIYYAVMKLCKVQILAECENFVLKRIRK